MARIFRKEAAGLFLYAPVLRRTITPFDRLRTTDDGRGARCGTPNPTEWDFRSISDGDTVGVGQKFLDIVPSKATEKGGEVTDLRVGEA